MQVLVVYNMIDQPDYGVDDDLLAEQENSCTEKFIQEALQQHGHRTIGLPIRDDLWKPLSQFDPREWFIFNLCESLCYKTSLEPYVTSVYEHLGFRYTGSGRKALTTCLDKARTKEILQAHGIATAKYEVMCPHHVDRHLDFPLFVKPVSEDASYGITLNSVVHDERALRRQLHFIWNKYHQPALVEQFIDGREFNVTILGNESPRILPLSEINFHHIADPFARIVSFRAKWVSHSEEFLKTPPACPAQVSSALKVRIEQVARRAYLALGLSDYGRVDLRVKDGTPYVLEVNPNADLAPDAGITRAAGVAGLSYADLIDEVVRLAARRQRVKGFARPRLAAYELKTRSAGSPAVYSIPVNALASRTVKAISQPAI